MLDTLLAKHAATDRVAYGDAGEQTAADLLRHAGLVAQALPTPSAEQSLVLVGVRRDAYACLAAMLGAWSRGYTVALPPPDCTRDGFLRLLQRADVAAVIHDTASTAALPIAELFARSEAAGVPRLTHARFVHDAQLLFLPSELAPEAAPLRVSGAQLLREASLVGFSLGLPEYKSYACSVLPDTRYGLTIGVLWPLLSGGAVLRDDPRDPEWGARLRQRALLPPVLVSVPAHIRRLWSEPEAPLRHVARVVSGGAPLPAAAFAVLREVGLGVCDLYAHPRYGSLGWRIAPARSFRPLLDVSVQLTDAASVAVKAPHVPIDASIPIRASRGFDGGFHPTHVGGCRAEWEEQIAWIDGVRDAALLADPAVDSHAADALRGQDGESGEDGEDGEDGGPAGPSWLLALSLESDAPADEVLRSQVARELPELTVAEWRNLRAPSAPSRSSPGFFSAGAIAGELRRNGAGRHDRVSLLRWFDRDSDGRPLSWTLAVGSEQKGAGTCSREVRVPSRYGYFAGHFPGYAILPGAAQLSELVLPFVRHVRPELGRLVRMARLKFQDRIVPNDSVEVHLTFPSDPACVEFSVRRGDNVCASGRLWFEPHPHKESGA